MASLPRGPGLLPSSSIPSRPCMLVFLIHPAPKKRPCSRGMSQEEVEMQATCRDPLSLAE
eukprot:3949294-Pyramimonas_sp.AAC.1